MQFQRNLDNGDNREKITISTPGFKAELPSYIIKQLKLLSPKYDKRISFFGGHPVSITRQSLIAIFGQHNQRRESPYLVCQKTDGVRYLLLIALVKREDYIDRKGLQYDDAQDLKVQCYLISREGSAQLVSYVSDINVSPLLAPATNQQSSGFKHIIEILDGEIIEDDLKIQKKMRYLIFDGLIHLGKNICKESLKQRLRCINKFIHYNDFLGIKASHKIQLKMKDFFRLTCPKFNTVEFMLKKYVKCLPHENDGLIFNHEEKEYILGTTNSGYVKWKPAHLNTVDFMIVPNQNLEDKYGRRVLELYLAMQNQDLQRYSRVFYAFTVIGQSQFKQIQQECYSRKASAYEKINEQQSNQEYTTVNQFIGALIAECRFDVTNKDQRNILTPLLHTATSDLRQQLMLQQDESLELKAIDAMKNTVLDKCWKIYKIRSDKGLPNNMQVARKIEKSIRDGINDQELIKKNNQLWKSTYAS